MITINQKSTIKGLFIFTLLLGIVGLFLPFGDKDLDWQESVTMLTGYYVMTLFLILMSLWILTTKLKITIDDGIMNYISNKKMYNKSYKMDSLLWWGVFYSNGGQSIQIKFPEKKVFIHKNTFTNVDDIVNYLVNHYPNRIK